MAEIRPFRGIRYSPSAVGSFSEVVCPPYDVISAAEAAALRGRSRHNAVYLELPSATPDDTPGHDGYTRAAALFRGWLDEGVLLREPSQAMYLLDEEFIFEGEKKHRQGLIAAVRLEDFEKGIVMPHERTTPGPKADRLELMRATRTNFSPVMSLYADPDRTIGRLLDEERQEAPLLRASPEGPPGYELRRISDPGLLSSISEEFYTLRLFVADGHHRYETALRFRDELEASGGALSPGAAARYMMMTLISMDDPGLLVLPYHRVFGGLEGDDLASLEGGLRRVFRVAPVAVASASAEETARTVQRHLAAGSLDDVVVAVFGLAPGEVHILTSRGPLGPAAGGSSLEQCDLWVLHESAIRPALGAEVESRAISFTHDAVEAVEAVRSGEMQVSFFLRALPMRLFEEIVGKGDRLPPKSTYFYPKLATGLVFNSLRGEL